MFILKISNDFKVKILFFEDINFTSSISWTITSMDEYNLLI